MKDGFFTSFNEVVDALKSGKAIRHCSWSGHQFYKQNVNNDKIINENGTVVYFDQYINPGNWSICEPPKPKIKIAQALYCVDGIYKLTEDLFQSREDAIFAVERLASLAGAYNGYLSFVQWPASKSLVIEVSE